MVVGIKQRNSEGVYWLADKLSFCYLWPSKGIWMQASLEILGAVYAPP